LRDCDAKGFRGPEVHYQLEGLCLPDGKISRVGALENLVHIGRRFALHVIEFCRVDQQFFRIAAHVVKRGQPIPQRQVENLFPVGVEVRVPPDQKVTIAFLAMNDVGAKGVIVAIDSFFSQLRSQIVDLALKYKLPAIAAAPSWADKGLLMSYGQDIAENWRRAAGYCDKILRGAKPGDLPVEQSTNLEFVVNLKTANTIGVSIPQTLLLRANRIIQE